MDPHLRQTLRDFLVELAIVIAVALGAWMIIMFAAGLVLLMRIV